MIFLILGSSGFIGKNLCKYLKSHGHDVLEFDIKNNRNQDLRITENKKLIESIDCCDFIFFLAFDVGGAKYLSKTDKNFDFISNNLKIINNTFEIINSSKKEFVFISSYQVYKSNHSYSVTKKIGEHFTHSLKGLIVRLYNVYGDEDIGLRSHVIPDLIYQAISSKKISLRTNGKEKRQFLHIEDCCKGLYSIFLNYHSILKSSYIIDLTSFEWISIRSIAKNISKKLKCELEFSDKQADFLKQPEPNKLILNYWNPQIKINMGIDTIINRYK